MSQILSCTARYGEAPGVERCLTAEGDQAQVSSWRAAAIRAAVGLDP